MFARLGLLGSSVCVIATTLTAQASSQTKPVSHPVSGIVTDNAQSPLSGVDIKLVRSGSTLVAVSTGDDGRFNFGDIADGAFVLEARKLGYEARVVNLNVGTQSSGRVEIVLKELPQKLEEVLVKAEENGRLKEFTQHKAERSNFGRYFDRSDIRKKNPTYASELFRSVPGVQVQGSSFGGNVVRVRGCKPLLWMDGQRVPGAELDEVARPSDIAAIEFYPSNAGIPPEYMDRNNKACGIILVWTKAS